MDGSPDLYEIKVLCVPLTGSLYSAHVASAVEGLDRKSVV